MVFASISGFDTGKELGCVSWVDILAMLLVSVMLRTHQARLSSSMKPGGQVRKRVMYVSKEGRKTWDEDNRGERWRWGEEGGREDIYRFMSQWRSEALQYSPCCRAASAWTNTSFRMLFLYWPRLVLLLVFSKIVPIFGRYQEKYNLLSQAGWKWAAS